MCYAFKVLASVINDALNGNWDKLASNAKKVAAEGTNISNNYKEGVKWQQKQQSNRDAANKRKSDLQKLDDDFKSKERQGRVTARIEQFISRKRLNLKLTRPRKRSRRLCNKGSR